MKKLTAINTLILSIILIIMIFMLINYNNYVKKNKFIHPPKKERLKNFENRLNFLIKQLDILLNFNQQQLSEINKIKHIIIENHNKNFKLPPKKLKLEFSKQIANNKMDINKIIAIIDSLDKDRKKHLIFMLNKISEFHQILNKNQRIKLSEKIKNLDGLPIFMGPPPTKKN